MTDFDRRPLYGWSSPGRVGLSMPANDVPQQANPSGGSKRQTKLNIPEMTQQGVVRYFTKLSQTNFSIDTNFYPLGSCTMKYNPKINEDVAFLDGFAGLHPNQTGEQVQGALQLMHELQRFLGNITGLSGVSLAPLAGAHGEYAGLSIARSYLNDIGEGHRNVAIIPDSAHGTNPASAHMSGLKVLTVQSDKNGHVDVNNLRQLADKNTAVFMLTLPNTLGLFEPNILEITGIIHDSGGLVYADGANLNALLGLARFADLGFDICHSNLHKTFSTPHGGGGPGAGPVMVTEKLTPYLPEPVVEKHNGAYRLNAPVKTIGKLSGFYGSFGILVRAYTYIMTFGKEWLSKIAEDAIINANYIQHNLKDIFECASGDQYCMHETVMSAKPQKSEHNVKALDIAKRLLDYGIHSPTMYFPLVVQEALMIEPTECESRETLDYFIKTMRTINEEVQNDPEILTNAPHTTYLSRLDEAGAARNPQLRWTDEV